MRDFPQNVQSIIDAVSKSMSKKNSIYLHRNWVWHAYTDEESYTPTGNFDFIITGNFDRHAFYSRLKEFAIINKEVENSDNVYHIIVSDEFSLRFVVDFDFDPSHIRSIRSVADFKLDSVFYDIRSNKYIASETAIQHISAKPPIIQSFDNEFSTEAVFEFMKRLTVFKSSEIEASNLSTLRDTKLQQLREPVDRSFADILTDILLTNHPGIALDFILKNFKDGNEWLLDQFIELAIRYNIPLEEGIDVYNLLSGNKLRLVDVYNEFFLVGKKEHETEEKRNHRFTTSLRLLFDTPSLSLKTPYVQDVRVLSKADVQRANTEGLVTAFAGTVITPGGEECAYGNCPPCVPEECSTNPDEQCCCCHHIDIILASQFRCHRQVVISCNEDGTAPGPSPDQFGNIVEPFLPECTPCFEACDIVLGDYAGTCDGTPENPCCDNLPEQEWWVLGQQVGLCTCECQDGFMQGNDCFLHCVTCDSLLCESTFCVTASDCNYQLTVQPSLFCCGGTAVVDFVFVIDFSGSMNNKIQEVKDQVSFLVDEIAEQSGVLRAGFVSFGRTPDNNVPQLELDLTFDIELFKTTLQNLPTQGGSEYDMWATVFAVESVEWGAALSKYLMLIGDEPTQIASPPDDFDLTDAIAACQQEGVVVYVVDTPSPQRGQLANTTGGLRFDFGLEFVDIIDLLDLIIIPTSCDCLDLTEIPVLRNEPQCLVPDPPDDCFNFPINICVPEQPECDCEQPFDILICGEVVVFEPENVNQICCNELPAGCVCPGSEPPGSECCGPECEGSFVCLPDGTRAFPTLVAAQQFVWCNCFENAAFIVTPGCTDCCCPNDDTAEPGDADYPCELLPPNDPNRLSGNCCGCEIINKAACCSCVIEMPDGEQFDILSVYDEVAAAWEDCEDADEPDIPPDWEPPPNAIDCTVPDRCIVGEPVGPVAQDQCPQSNKGCTAVRNPDTLILNNGVGLVAYETMDDVSTIKIQQFKTSLKFKLLPNREFNFGRLQHQSGWLNNLAKLYVYDFVPKNWINGQVAPDFEDPDSWADVIAFENGPLERQLFPLYDPPWGSDSVGTFIHFHVPAGLTLSNAFPSSDDKYDVKWFIYDADDQGLIGDAMDVGSQFIYSNRQPVDDELLLQPHIYNGEQAPVANPSITHARNYQDHNENAHFVYLAYQAFEDNKWQVYIRTLRLSEYERDSQVDAESGNLISLEDLGITTVVYRVVCVSDDCNIVGNDTVVTRTVVMEVLTLDGREVLNEGLSGNWPSLCQGLAESEFPKDKVFASLAHTVIADDCPDHFGFNEIFFDWQAGDEFQVPAIDISATSLFTSISPSDDTSIGIGEFGSSISLGGVNITSASVGAVWYDNIVNTVWSVIQDPEFKELKKFKGLDISEPILLTQNERGHCTNPVVRVNYNNDIVVVYETTEDDGLPQITVIGTAAPSSSLPFGNLNPNPIDAGFNYFLQTDDFSFRQQITTSSTDKLNQLPDMFIDFNDVVHLAWQTNRDNYWEIYYANSENKFVNKRITNFKSRSLRPSISGDDDGGNLFITWHDDRFGNWEIMLAYYDSVRILPLAQQDPYLASIRNDGYIHVTGLIPITVTNTTGSTLCITNLIVNFYDDRNFDNFVFSVTQQKWPFAFTVPDAENDTTTKIFTDFSDWTINVQQGDDPDDPYFGGPDLTEVQITSSAPHRFCLSPGESATAYLDLTPEVRVDKSGANTEPFPIPAGFARNNSYFVQIRVQDSDGVFFNMPDPQMSVSCENCTSKEAEWSDVACTFPVDVTNSTEEVQYYNFRVIFYSDVEEEREVTRFTATPGSTDLQCFTYRDNQSAESVWTDFGLRVGPNESTDLLLWPALSPTSGLLCGIPYRVVIFGCSTSESETTNPEQFYAPCRTEDMEELSFVTRWTCNCQSVRWDPRFEDAAANLNEIIKWNSSGDGRSDRRITETHSSSINPVIKIRQNHSGVIMYASNRPDTLSSEPEVYKIYASVFQTFPRTGMYASGAQNILSHHQFIIHQSDIPFGFIGINPSLSLDQFDSVFLAYEEPLDQTECEEFVKDKQQIIKVTRCGADPTDLFEDPETEEGEEEETCETSEILSKAFAEFKDPVFASIVREARVNNEFVKYHVYRDNISMPVVKQCNVVFTIWRSLSSAGVVEPGHALDAPGMYYPFIIFPRDPVVPSQVR